MLPVVKIRRIRRIRHPLVHPQSLVTWDGGNQLTYPIKYHSIGYKEEIVPDFVNSTGFVHESQKVPGLEIEEVISDDN